MTAAEFILCWVGLFLIAVDVATLVLVVQLVRDMERDRNEPPGVA